MEELNQIKGNEIFSQGYKKKKLIRWFIRTFIATILYVIFWKYQWVQWSLWVYVPMNLMGLALILFLPKVLKKRQEKIENQYNEL